MYSSFIALSQDSITNIQTLLGLDMSEMYAKRIISFITGGILPIIALTFVKGVTEYFKED